MELKPGSIIFLKGREDIVAGYYLILEWHPNQCYILDRTVSNKYPLMDYLYPEIIDDFIVVYDSGKDEK